MKRSLGGFAKWIAISQIKQLTCFVAEEKERIVASIYNCVAGGQFASFIAAEGIISPTLVLAAKRAGKGRGVKAL